MWRTGLPGGPRTHGKHSEREPAHRGRGAREAEVAWYADGGVWAASALPSESFGRADCAEENLILLKGAVPGRRRPS